MATRKFVTKKGKVVEFRTGGGKRGRGKAAEDTGAAHRGEEGAESEGAREAAGTEAVGQRGAQEAESLGGYDPARDTGGGEASGGTAEADADQSGEQTEPERTGEERPAAGEAEERSHAVPPREVRWKDVSGEPEYTPPSSMATALGQLAAFGFQIPQMAGLGNQWPLDPREERNWGRSLEGCIKALPQKSKKAAITAISRWIPWISLSMTAYITVMPRVLMTQMGRVNANPQSTGDAERPSRTVRRENPTPDGEYGGLPTWEDYRRNG